MVIDRFLITQVHGKDEWGEPPAAYLIVPLSGMSRIEDNARLAMEMERQAKGELSSCKFYCSFYALRDEDMSDAWWRLIEMGTPQVGDYGFIARLKLEKLEEVGYAVRAYMSVNCWQREDESFIRWDVWHKHGGTEGATDTYLLSALKRMAAGGEWNG